MIHPLALAAACATISVQTAAATVHRVLPGTPWDGISLNARPGDEIVLEPGVHRPARIADLAGEPDRPIVIRARDANSLAEIRGGPSGLELVRPSHVEVRNLFIRDVAGAGLAIVGDADRPARGVLLRNCLLSGCGVAGRTPAIRIERVEGLTIADSRIQGFGPAAISIEPGRNVRLERIQLVSAESGPDRVGISISGGSDQVEIDRSSVASSLGAAFSIGWPVEGSPPASEAALAANVSIRNVLSVRNAVFVRIGSARAVDLRRNTIVDPLDTPLLVGPPPKDRPPAAAVRFRGNLVAWTPNTLKRLSGVAAGSVDRPDVEYGANLWFSPELPAALPLLGTWEGRVAEQQVTDLDPRLDNVSMPLEPAAKAFGIEPAR